MRALRASLRRVAIVAWGETCRTGGSFDRKTGALLLVLALATAFVVPLVSDGGLDFDRGIYRVAYDPAAPLAPAALSAGVFASYASADPAADLAAGRADLAIEGARVLAPDTEKGRAALAALERATEEWNYRRLLEEPDAAAAFPVRVEVVYAAQARPDRAPGIPAGGGTPAPEDDAGLVEGESSGGGAEAAPVASEPGGGFSFLPPERSVNTPATLAPPFPFRSLVLAYLFLLPMNFVVQVYAGSVISERVGRKGEALLASPVRAWEAVAGKTLPYLVLMLAVSGAVALWIGAGWLSLLAVTPLVLAFLGLEFVAAMFARSFRELTFLTVFASVLLTIYAFLPAVFADVHPVALVSPISLVVMDLRGAAPSLAEAIYAFLPLSLLSLVLFVLGTALWREEDMFHQKPVHAKALDALARQVRGLPSAVKLAVVLIPGVFVAELLLVTFLFAWPVPVGLLGVLVAVAVVEELAKGVPSYAALARGAVPPRRALAFGALAGLGFFLAEKGFLLASLTGLFDVPAGSAVFGAAAAGVGSAAPLGLVALLLLGPLALHVATASLSAWGAARGRARFLQCLALSVAVHTAYNWTIVEKLGGGA